MKDKKIILLIILVLISIVTLVGSSYALLTKSLTSSKLSIEVGTLKVDFAEGNAINLTNAVPMSDSDGMNTTPYTFTITNSGTLDAYYTVSNEEDTTNTLDTSYLKMKLISDDGYDSGVVTVKNLGSETYKIVNEKQLKASKSVTYKLYLWVSSDAGNDIQNKTYQSKIVVNSTSNKTEQATLLRGTAEDMIATANAETLDYDSATDNQKNQMWTFSHDATEQTTALTDYRYIGKDPNNYVTFNDELWRIIGVFDVDDGTGNVEKRLKIIRNKSIGNYSWSKAANSSSSMKVPTSVKNSKNKSSNNYFLYNKSSETIIPTPMAPEISSDEYGSNDWTKADINYLLNPNNESLVTGGSLYWNRKSGTYYYDDNSTFDYDFTSTGLTSVAQSMIGDAKWYLGDSKTTYNTSLADYYTGERSTTVYSEHSTNWTGKIGLIYPSDYVYATSGGSTTNKTSCLSTSGWYNYSDCYNNDWLHLSDTLWTITSSSSSSIYAYYLYGEGYITKEGAILPYYIHPTLYLKSSIKITSGTGTSSNPYILG